MAASTVKEDDPVEPLERDDIQGLVASGYAEMAETRYLLLEILEPRAAARWLESLADRITSSREPETVRCLNVAFTAAGLTALGVQIDDLRTFAAPFQEGITSPNRQRVLGDTGPSHPQNWEWGGLGLEPATVGRLHVLLMIYARDEVAIHHVLGEETARSAQDGALGVLRTLAPEALPGVQRLGKFGVEHFGFADGMSQPVIKGLGSVQDLAPEDVARHVIAPGEFVLGYPNGHGELTPSPRLSLHQGTTDVGRNGSYLVVRQLAQDVWSFRQLLATAAADDPEDPDAAERLAAKLIGRWRSGAPVTSNPHQDAPGAGGDNSFGYAKTDLHGEGCPLGAHIRRSNPRDALGHTSGAEALRRANLHRIIRRGRVYGAGLPDEATGPDKTDRGLIFMCVNANIERQFEFIQQSWCNNPKFAGLYEEQDPILGSPPEAKGIFTVQGSPIAIRQRGLRSYVTVRGGGYFFLPGVRALRALAALH